MTVRASCLEQDWERAEHRRARWLAAGWLALAAAVPLALWHRILLDSFVRIRVSPHYLVGELAPWMLIFAGLGFLVPVVVSTGRSPESRLYPNGRGALLAWGVVLYLLGIALALQVAQIAALSG